MYNNIKPYIFTAVLLFLLACSHSRRAAGGLSAEQNNTRGRQPVFLFLSDIHLNTDSVNTQYGYDTGTNLWTAFLNKAGAVLSGPNPPQFVLYTGDLPAHYPCPNNSCYLAPANRADHNKNLAAILTGLQTLANFYKVPFFYLPGNNDGMAGDYASFADELQQTPFSLVPPSGDSFPALNILPGNTKAPCMLSRPQPAMGYYSARPIPGLRLICLNTVLYSKDFVAVDGSNVFSDRAAQLSWMGTQLAAAQALNEKVYIAMHIPPGKDAYSGKDMWDDKDSSWMNIFLGLTTRYQAAIAGVFYGHTHMDEVRRLYDSTGTTVTQVAISCPGVTPQHYNNPGFKTVSFNPRSKAATNFVTYYTTPGSSTWGDSSYSFNSAYGGGTDSSIFMRLRYRPLPAVSTAMGTVYTVMHGPASFNIEKGIEVVWGK